MDFEFTEDQLALRANARDVLAAACPPSLVRRAYDGAAAGDELWPRLVELDWPGLGVAEEHGGLGLGPVEVGIVVEELGRAVAPSPFLATATQLVPALREAGATALLPDVAAGRCTGTLALAEDGVWRFDAVRATARRTDAGWVLDGTKTHVLDGATADWIAVVARAEGTGGREGLGAFVVPSAAVSASPLAVLDPTVPLATVVLDGVEVPDDAVLVEPGDPRAASVVERSVE
jgi:alkylation response protein AidB-like acyl-CoA dehydrogenase